MLKRRGFLVATALFGISSYIDAKETDHFHHKFTSVEKVIAIVQEHMFPLSSDIPSARETRVSQFLYETIAHASYDKEIRIFVVEGAKELLNREKKALFSKDTTEIEKALRRYEKTDYGKVWLSRIIILTMEGIFSDPIYATNKKEIGWKSIHAYGGYPRAKGRYLEDV